MSPEIIKLMVQGIEETLFMVSVSTVIAAIVGILLNAILPGNDYEFDAADGTDAATSGNLQV